MRTQAAIAEVGEVPFLRRLLRTFPAGPGVIVGAGDDCAVLASGGRRLLLTTDALVDGVHFRRAWMTPRQIGRKAYLVNASDIAAMGGRPRFCVVSVGVPPQFPSRDLTELHRGIVAAAAGTGARVVGGNLARAAALFVSITLLGDAPARPLRRRGARPGDALYVTGRLGEAALGLRLLRRNHRARGPAVRRFREPVPRLRAGMLLARPGGASAMIDISDGLVRDLEHLCAASGVGARIDGARLPAPASVRRLDAALALSGGEDYELLCAVPARNVARVERLRPKLGCAFTRVGEVLPRPLGIQVLDARGRPVSIARAGFDHFAGARRR